MEQGFVGILEKLIAERGKESLLNRSNFKAILADYTRNEYKKESRFLLQALEAGVHKAINASKELRLCKKQQIRLLHEDYGLSENLAVDVVDTLALVLRGDTSVAEASNIGIKSSQPGIISQAVTGNTSTAKRSLNIKDMIHIPGGSFEMGRELGSHTAGDVTPVHKVTLSSFYIGMCPVTQEQYQAVMGSNPSHFSSDPASGEIQRRRPVEMVSWYEAIVFCNRLSVIESLSPAYQINGSTNPTSWGAAPASTLGWADPITAIWNTVQIVSGSTGYRLPTEAQWEYAAKGGNGSPCNFTYSGSNDPDAVAWYSDNSNEITHEVGLKCSNGLGLCDMSGNVYERCWDWSGGYSSVEQTDPLGASSGSLRVLRGGGWCNNAQFLRSAFRDSFYPWYRSDNIGFRLVRL